MTGPRRPPRSLHTSLRATATALGWVLLTLGSIASGLIALWITSSMARLTNEGSDDFTSSGVWVAIVAVVVTFGVPFALATWQARGDSRRIRTTMTWLPLVWNAGGLILASQLVPDVVGRALRSHGARVAAQELGDSHAATRVLSALGHNAADFVDPPDDGRTTTQGAPRLTLTSAPRHDIIEEQAISVPFIEEGTAILLDVTLEGPKAELELTYLFDTGASFTTLSTDTAAALGVAIPDDAPTLKFNTASGSRDSKMVYLDALRLGSVRIPGLLVSVCDACVNERTGGLLGLNVMREFYAQMDYKNRRMTLLPRVQEHRPNRAYDIEPVVDLEVEGTPEVWLGRVRWIVRVHNRGSQPIENVTPVVKFTDGPSLLGRTVERIEPGESGRSLIEGRAAFEGDEGGSRGQFTLTLFEAYW